MTTAQAELEAEIVSRLAELLPGADRPALAARVTELGLKPRGARSLRDHVTGHDDALTSGDSSAPAAHLRLLRVLRTDFSEVQAARCERCGQVRESSTPTRSSDGPSVLNSKTGAGELTGPLCQSR